MAIDSEKEGMIQLEITKDMHEYFSMLKSDHKISRKNAYFDAVLMFQKSLDDGDEVVFYRPPKGKQRNTNYIDDLIGRGLYKSREHYEEAYKEANTGVKTVAYVDDIDRVEKISTLANEAGVSRRIFLFSALVKKHTDYKKEIDKDYEPYFLTQL